LFIKEILTKEVINKKKFGKYIV